MKLFFILSLGLSVLFFHSTVVATEKAGTLIWEQKGFLQPESAVFDAINDRLFVSSINGQPMEPNGNGFISVLTTNGEMIQQAWLTGLNAPKGLAISGNQLFIADLQTLHIVNINTAEIERSITLDNAKMLNDVTVDKAGTVYISDLIGGGIYQYKAGALTPLISPEALPHTNGVYADGDHLIVGTWGKGLKEDFSTEVLGSLMTIDLQSKAIEPLSGAETIANIDGVVRIDDSLYFSDWLTGDIFQYQSGEAKIIFNAGAGSADISAFQDTLLVPMMMDNTVRKYAVK